MYSDSYRSFRKNCFLHHGVYEYTSGGSHVYPLRRQYPLVRLHDAISRNTLRYRFMTFARPRSWSNIRENPLPPSKYNHHYASTHFPLPRDLKECVHNLFAAGHKQYATAILLKASIQETCYSLYASRGIRKDVTVAAPQTHAQISPGRGETQILRLVATDQWTINESHVY